MRPRSLMTAYAEGSLVSRELREMLNDEAASARFDAELAVLDNNRGGVTDSDQYGDHVRELMRKGGAL